MKKNLLLTALLMLVAATGMAKGDQWSITLTAEDGLPGIKEPRCYYFRTQLYRFDHDITRLRLTVVSTNTSEAAGADSYEGMSGGWGPAFPFFSLGELQVSDANHTPIAYTATANAIADGDGSLASINDGKFHTHFHSTYGSSGNCPQEYHYIELELAHPVSEFMLEWRTRDSYTMNMPTYVGITPGTQYLPYPEQEFKTGKQVTAAEELGEGCLFLIESNTEEYIYSENRTIAGGGFYHSPYGAHTTANAASLVYLIPAYEENTYKVAWLNNGHYIKASSASNTGWLQWTDKETDAAHITFTPCEGEDSGDFGMTTRSADGTLLTISADAIGKMAITATGSEAALSRPNKPNFTIHKASVNANSIKFLLEETMAEAAKRIEQSGYNGKYDNGEYTELCGNITKAENILADRNSTVADILECRYDINKSLPPYAMLSLSIYLDSIDGIVKDIENGTIKTSVGPGWTEGTYPAQAIELLQHAMDASMLPYESSGNIDCIDTAIEEAKKGIANFWASRISSIRRLPFRVSEEEEEGLPGNKEAYGGYVWESPMYYLAEEVDTLRFTVFDTSNSAKYGSHVFFALAEFELYGLDGEKIELTDNCFATNSIVMYDGNGFGHICDGNTATYYHAAWEDGQAPNGFKGESHVYLEVALPEAISCFRYRQYGHKNAANTPTDFVFGHTGEEITPDNVMLADPYNAVCGERITSIDDITDGGIYAIQGLYGCDPVNGSSKEPRFYTGINAHGKNIRSSCAYSITKNKDGKYNIRSLADGKYWSRQIDEDGWCHATSTLFSSQAADIAIEPSGNSGLPGSFVLYQQIDTVVRNGEKSPYVIFQDWDGSLGAYSTASLDAGDKDGEGEWYIYRMTMDTPYCYWLQNLVPAAEAMGIVRSNDPGCYSNVGTFPTLLTLAQAAVNRKDHAECQSLAAQLSAAIAEVESASRNPIAENRTYILEAASESYFESQGTHKAMYVWPNNETSGDVTSAYKFYWGDSPYDYGEYYSAEDAYQYQFTLIPAKESEKVQQWIADGTVTAEEADNAFYIRNVEYGVYLGKQDGTSKAIGTTEAPEAVYIFRHHLPYKFEIWNPESRGWSLHAQGHNNGNGYNGDIVYWQGADDMSQWRLRDITSPPARTYSIELEGENGTLSGDGRYFIGEPVRITAVPAPGYIFAGWYIGDTLLSDSAGYTFTPSTSMTITARFQKATGISGTAADSLRISTASGTLIVESGKEMKLPIYSTDGRLVEMLPVAAGKNLFNGLGKGTYIVKGTKVILR